MHFVCIFAVLQVTAHIVYCFTLFLFGIRLWVKAINALVAEKFLQVQAVILVQVSKKEIL